MAPSFKVSSECVPLIPSEVVATSPTSSRAEPSADGKTARTDLAVVAVYADAGAPSRGKSQGRLSLNLNKSGVGGCSLSCSRSSCWLHEDGWIQVQS